MGRKRVKSVGQILAGHDNYRWSRDLEWYKTLCRMPSANSEELKRKILERYPESHHKHFTQN